MNNIRNQILKWIEERIFSGSDYVIPLKKLRAELVEGLTVPIPPLEEITAWIAEDERFDLLPEPEGAEDIPEEQAAILELKGIYNGPRVGLKAKRPSQEEILRRLEEHSNRLLSAVQKGYIAGDIKAEIYNHLEENVLDFLEKIQAARKQT